MFAYFHALTYSVHHDGSDASVEGSNQTVTSDLEGVFKNQTNDRSFAAFEEGTLEGALDLLGESEI